MGNPARRIRWHVPIRIPSLCPRGDLMAARIVYTIAAVCVTVAAVLFSIAAYEWLKEHEAPADNVYPLQRRTL